jgi:hypothetical protein
MRSSNGTTRSRTSSGDVSRPMSRSMQTRSSNPGSTSRPSYTPPTRSYDSGSSRSSGGFSSGSSRSGGGFSGGGGGGSSRSSGGRTR